MCIPPKDVFIILLCLWTFIEVSSVAQSCLIFETPWTAAHQASLSITNSQSLLNSCPSSQWCHPAISSSVIPFFSCFQSFPVSGSFPISEFFTSGGQNIGTSAASVLHRWKILKEMGIPDHLTCLLRNLHASQEATVSTRHGLVPNWERSMSWLYIVTLII